MSFDFTELIQKASNEQKLAAITSLKDQIRHWLWAIDEDISGFNDIDVLLGYRNAVHDLFHELRNTPNDGGEQKTDMDKVVCEALGESYD